LSLDSSSSADAVVAGDVAVILDRQESK